MFFGVLANPFQHRRRGYARPLGDGIHRDAVKAHTDGKQFDRQWLPNEARTGEKIPAGLALAPMDATHRAVVDGIIATAARTDGHSRLRIVENNADNIRIKQRRYKLILSIEVRPDLLAVFGKIHYHPNDEREDGGIYAALIDTSGELLSDAFIRGEGIENNVDIFTDILQIEPTRVLAMTALVERICSIQFDLDPHDHGVAESNFRFFAILCGICDEFPVAEVNR